MGIYDREYIRVGRGGRGPGGGGGGAGLGGMRMWSFNTWLIVVNIAIFVIDALIATQGVTINVDMGTVFKQDVEDARIQQAEVIPTQQPSRTLPGVRADRIVDTRGDTIDDAALRQAQLVSRDGREFVAIGNNVYEVIGERRHRDMPPLQGLFHFSTGKLLGIEFWRLVGFQFLHADMTHLLFNMIGLFFFGGLVEGYLGAKRYAAFYLVCGIFGAFAYLLLNLIGYLMPPGAQVPGLLFNDIYTPLIGASAGVFGVLMAAAFIAPNSQILLFFVLPMRLRTAVYGFIIIAAVSLLLGAPNAGGEAAHLGGAIAGFYFIRHTHLLRDFFEILGPKRPKGGAPKSPRKKPRRDGPPEKELDRVLSKVATQGLHSLTDAERRTLRQATESRRRP
ncbi:MAG: rhomboid family intramembrane serine protease [Phycisphaeraceae bacterium]|nr:MAG: rhomboid family intramembrane serine protease [Phycisphaeraceae bacterium]